MDRHEALRLQIDPVVPRQRVVARFDAPVEVIDLSGESDPEAAFLALADAMIVRPFELSHGPLFKVTLARLDDKLWYSLLRCHHLIVDGLSIATLTRVLAETYTALARGGDIEGIEQSTYLDFAAAEAAYCESLAAQRDLDYWRERFSTVPERVFDPRTSRQGPPGPASSTLLRWQVERDRYEAFLGVCATSGVRALPALLALVGALVRTLTQQDDVVIGVAIPGRGGNDLAKIGMFNGALPVRLRIEADRDLKALAVDTGKQIARDYRRRMTPIDVICRTLELAKKGRRGVFDVFMSYIPAELTSFDFDIVGVPVEPTILRGQEANPLAIYVSESNQNRPILVEFAFNETYLARPDAELLLNRFQRLFDKFVTTPDSALAALDLFDDGERRRLRGRTEVASQQPVLRVIATFSAQPIEPGLAYWGRKLGMGWNIEFAHYSQLFQELLDPASETRANQCGANLVLLRVEDWLRHRVSSSDGRTGEEFVRETAATLGDALRTAASVASVPLIVMICAPSASWEAAGPHGALQIEVENALRGVADGLPGLSVVTYRDCRANYPVAREHDSESDRLGHVPYTRTAFMALATYLARRAHLALRPATKVLIVDCDNTLWGGVVGEDGVEGIRIERCHLDLQRRLVAAADAGILVCLCSKNVESDVLDVFARRSEMVLTLDRVTSHRINWQPKSHNILALASELELALESMAFLDDNPIEIAEVEANCRGIVGIVCDHGAGDATPAAHLWLLDAKASTAEDRRRTQMYRENASRTKLRDQTGDYALFISSLALKIRFEVPTDRDLVRLEQLTERTTQFNINGVRRSVGDLAAARARADQAMRAVFVEDRFGDYGLVGFVLARAVADCLLAETLLMSCRVLGRGVEHAIIAELGAIAGAFGRDVVRIPVRKTNRNLPVRQFLATVGGVSSAGDEQIVLTLTKAEALGCRFEPEKSGAAVVATEAPAPEREEPAAPLHPAVSGSVWAEIASKLGSAAHIEHAIEEATKVGRSGGAAYREPATAIERNLCEYADRLVGLERIGLDDDLFEIGLNSLLAVQLVAHIRSSCDVELPIRALFECQTIGRLGEMVDAQRSVGRSYSALVPLQKGDSAAPLFCIHAANGDAVSFMRLAKALGPEQTVYGLEARGLAPNETMMTSIDEMAEAYIAEIRKVCPEGPYYFAGWSFGGPVAYEMSVRLAKAGEQIGLLAFMDCPTPFGQDQPALTYDDVLRIFAIDLDSIERKFDVPLTAWARSDRKVTIEEVIATSQRLGVAPPEYSIPEAQRKIAVFNNCVSLFRRWTPPSYDGPILLFRPVNQDPGIPYEWERYTNGKITTIMMPCNHVRLGFEPFVQTVADQILERMRQPTTPARVSRLDRLGEAAE